MTKKVIAILLVLVMMLSLSACAKTRTVTCDRCGTDVEVEKNSKITDDWIVFCKECEAESGPIVEPGN